MAIDPLLLETAFVGATLVVTALVVARTTGRERVAAISIAIVIAVAGLIVLNLLGIRAAAEEVRRELVSAKLPIIDQSDRGYIGSDACRACHPTEHASWYGSWHRTMTQIARPETVLGDFDNVTFDFDDRDIRLRREGDEFWVEMPNPDHEIAISAMGHDPDVADIERVERRVVMTTGFHHYQAYWVPGYEPSAETNNLINFPFVWLRDEERWLPREAVFLRPPDAPRLLQTWNNNCLHCHAVAGEEKIDYQSLLVASEVAELGISCEACHGPGAEHAALNRNPLRRVRLASDDAYDDSIVQPSRLEAHRSAEVCGQCHSITMPLMTPDGDTLNFTPGERLADFKQVIRATDANIAEADRELWQYQMDFIRSQDENFFRDRYWPDGMVRVSGREYTGLLESPCYQSGELSCLTCHSMHDYVDPADQMRPGAEGDASCISCHEDIAADIPAHTHHPADSVGSSCLNCHMPHTVYGLVKAIRSHQVESPNAARTQATGRPDGCSLCHLDRPLGWVADTLASWYGTTPPDELTDEERSIAGGARWLLSGDAAQRALVAWSAGWAPAREASGSDWMTPYLGQLVDDPYAVVRTIAIRALREHPDFADLDLREIDPPATRAAAAARIIDGWRGDGAHPSVLVGKGGILNLEAFRALLARRDDTPLSLQE